MSIASSYDGIIHLLISDVIIPDMNGIQLYSKIKKARPEIKVIFISGYTANIVTENGLPEEEINFIQKPFQ